MYKKIIILSLACVAFALSAVSVSANTLSLRVSQPKTPINQNFPLNFVSLDIAGNTITVKCFKKAPSDGGFSQFGGDIVLSAGGNTSNCTVDGAVLGAEGTYQFYVTATNGADTITSSTITVDYKTSGPGTPTNYGKGHPESCKYVINFRTADDAGKTVKVELYRSTNTTFSADSGTKVDSVAIGSNTDGSFTNFVPDCNVTNYFAIRAFDSVGNGSGVVGDSETQVTTTTTTNTTTTSSTNGSTGTNATTNTGAIETQNGTVTSPSPEAGVSEAPTSAEKEVLGAKNTKQSGLLGSLGDFLSNTWVKGLGIIVLLGALYFVARRFILSQGNKKRL